MDEQRLKQLLMQYWQLLTVVVVGIVIGAGVLIYRHVQEVQYAEQFYNVPSTGTGSDNSSSSDTSSNSSQSQTPPSSASSASSSTSNQAHVGDTISISKSLSVTLKQVIDPAQAADQYITADSGKRFVAVDLQITNTGSTAMNDDANNDVAIIGSDNQTYTNDDNSVAECTDFNTGSFTLGAGESTTGCVNFQLPNGVNATKIQYTPNSGSGSTTGEWLVP